MRSELEPEPELMISDTITTPKIIGPHEHDPQVKYAPYVRNDSYGIMGRGQLPWTEKVLLAVAMLTLLPLRVAAATVLVVLCYLTCRICTAFLAPNEHGNHAHLEGWRRKVIVANGRSISRALLFAFGFYWIDETHRCHHHIPPPNSSYKARSEEEEEERAGVIVSNHVSYTDILYHMSSSCASFVAKKSVAKLPLVGLISKCHGCIYVQRESKTPDLNGVSGVVNQRIQEAYKNKFSPMVILFPEGTTTNGDFLLPFKTGAFVSKAPVHPVIIRYPYRRLSPAWDSISGARHLILLLCQFVNHMEVIWLPVYYPSQQEKDDPKLYAENVRRFMAHEGSLILSDIGLAEKRAYLSACNGNKRSTANNHQKDN